MSVTSFSKAYIFYTKATEFTNIQRNEHEVLKIALKECKESFNHYVRIKHKYG
jgi:hypothetical protein